MRYITGVDKTTEMDTKIALMRIMGPEGCIALFGRCGSSPNDVLSTLRF